MNLTNPPIVRGLGKTGLLNRKGLTTGRPTLQGLAQTATPQVRDPGVGGQPLKVTQLASATDNFVLIVAEETDAVQLSINRLGGSELDINCGIIISEVAGDDGAGPPFTVLFKVYRGATLIANSAFFLPVANIDTTAADQIYQGNFFTGYVDSDYVSGVVVYKLTVEITDSADASVGGGLINGTDAYLRVLERKL